MDSNAHLLRQCCFILLLLTGMILSTPRPVLAKNTSSSSLPSSTKSSSWLGRFLGKTESGLPRKRDGFEILKESEVYRGWRTVLRRTIRLRNGKVADFDLVGMKTDKGGVMIFAWNTYTKTATVIREYMPGSHKILWGLAAGLVEDKHGGDVRRAASDELEEEAQLRGGVWLQLTKHSSAMDKYALTTVDAYLVLDPEHALNPKPLDDEEDIEVVSGVTIPQIMEWIVSGEMNLVSAWGCLLAIEKLREIGEYP